MTVYIQIEPLNGRRSVYDLASKLETKGFGDGVEYNSGGWNDRQLGNIAPHLKFEDDEDAIAFVLAYGGKISKTLPVASTWEADEDEKDQAWSRAIKR